MNIVLFDSKERSNLFPLALNKAIADLRVGILTIKERWERLLNADVFVLTEDYLQELYEPIPTGECVYIDASVIPGFELLEEINSIQSLAGISDINGTIAYKGEATSISEVRGFSGSIKEIERVRRIRFPHHLFLLNDEMIRFDYVLNTKGRTSAKLSETVTAIHANQIFIEEGAIVEHCILNASTGPVHIGKNATIMEGSFIRGPFAMGEGAVLKMGSKIYGATTIGPYCTAGGEIKNSILSGYSNKAHDGYLGDSVISEWCNFGAGTSNSNVKNTGGIVQLWNYQSKGYVAASNKCGVIMGDFSRTAINTSINTGTVIGLSSNVFGTGLTPKFIPDFSWGYDEANLYDFEKVIIDINNWKKMKNKSLSAPEAKVLKHIFDKITSAFI